MIRPRHTAPEPAPAPKLYLVAVASKAEAMAEKAHTQTAVARAEGAVPLVWTALFEYEETEVADAGGVQCFFALSQLPAAIDRLRALLRVVPAQAEVLREALALALRALERTGHSKVALFPVALFRGLESGQARAQLQRLSDQCDAWKALREGLPWADACSRFARLGVEVSSARTASALVGELPGCQSYIEEFLLVSEGQSQGDRTTEAIAVGAYGTALGRFDGVWKLMSSDCDSDLLAVSGWKEGALAVGAGGVVTQFAGGRWQRLEAPTTFDLRAIGPLDANTLCVIGDQGTVLLYDDAGWRQVRVPSRGSLRCLWARGRNEVYIGEEAGFVLGFDGYGWKRMELPVAAPVHHITAVEGRVIAAGGTEAGGLVFCLDRGRWLPDGRVPRVGTILGGWSGWDGEEGLVSRSGAALVFGPAGWASESMPVDEVLSAVGGSCAMALGRASGYSVILSRSEAGWRMEAGVPELALHGLWVAGKAKPPRRAPAAAPPANGDDARSSQ